MQLTDFHNLHAGETALLVGNGPNLKLTPPEWFDYPSFGMNTIHLYEGWKPSYYVTVDFRVMNEFGDAVLERFADIPKFIPRPNLDAWQGENFYRFYHRAGDLFIGGHTIKDKDALDFGISYRNVMQCAMLIAAYMGFTTLLLIGVEHKADGMLEHFWGKDSGMRVQPRDLWFDGYRTITSMLGKVRVLNISEGTHVPENVLARDDWKKWRNT